MDNTTLLLGLTTNSSSHDEDDSNFNFVLFKLVCPIVFGLCTLTGLIGNSLVIYIILSKNKMRTVTNIFLLNLAISDISFICVTPPFTALNFALSTWYFGAFVCKMMMYLLNVTVYVTIYTLVVISGIRYLTVVYNTETQQYRTKRNAVFICLAIWFIMLFVNMPIIPSYGLVYNNGTIDCDMPDFTMGKPIYATFTAFAYVIPLLLIMSLSMGILIHLKKQKTSMLGTKAKGKDKKKQASRLLIIVVLVFAIFWLPVHVHLLVAYFGTISKSNFYAAVSLFWNLLAYSNSCVNPIIYNYASKEFRDGFREIFCRKKLNSDTLNCKEKPTRNEITVNNKRHDDMGEMNQLMPIHEPDAQHLSELAETVDV